MPDPNRIAQHYTHGELINEIRAGLVKTGKTTSDISIDDLAPVDEFHIGGRLATQPFLDQLDIESEHHVLDVGCGLGGSSRFAAQTYGCRISGVDLTQEYVDTGTELCAWVGLDRQITLQVADATDLPHSAEAFDRAYLLHVGMNIANKNKLASELFRVLRSGAKIGIYDIMRLDDGPLVYPMPWATGPDESAVASLYTYKSALEEAGFRVTGERNRREFALEFFATLKKKAAASEGPPALGLHLLMGSTAAAKIGNMAECVARGLLAPIEVFAQKP